MATYYVRTTGNDSTGNGATGTPWLTLGHAFGEMSSGDVLVVGDGTYASSGNQITMAQRPPSGPGTGTGDARFTVVKAEHDGAAILSQAADRCMALSTDDVSWLKFEGLIFTAPGTTAANHHVCEIADVSETAIEDQAHHIYFSRCGGYASVGGGNASVFQISASYALVEDCYFWGRSRYGLAFRQPGFYQLQRRCVYRLDDVDMGGLGSSGTTFYGTRYGACQNSIILDVDGKYFSNGFYPYMGFLGRDEDGSAFPATHLAWVGCIVLNIQQPSEDPDWYSIALQGTNNYQFENCSVSDCVAWDVDRGYGMVNFSAGPIVNPSYNRLTIGEIKDTSQGTKGDGIYSMGSTPITNVIATGCRGYGFYDCTAADYLCGYDNGTNWTTVPAHNTTDNPLANGLTYLPRIEDGSALKTAGSGGGQIGAQIVKRIGVDGTFYGDTDYDTVTNVDLWPFPNEDLIRATMRAYTPTYNPGDGAGPSPTRGFCAGGETLTHYIWNYLGNGGLPTETTPTMPVHLLVTQQLGLSIGA